MILKGAEAGRYFAKPDPGRAGLLICGEDAMRVALRRQEVVAALIGPQGDAEMRLARLAGADLRRDPALLMDAMKAQGFFPGPRVALVEDATETTGPAIAAALADWRAGDAQIVVTAGGLPAKSGLRKLFEAHPNALCAVLYDTPPTPEEVESALKRAGLSQIDREAMADLTTLAQSLDPGDFRQMLEKIALYKWRDPSPLTPLEVATLAPATIDAEVDEVLLAAAEFRSTAIPPLLRRLEGQGTSAVTLCIRALQHFRALHVAAADPAGPASGMLRARVFGPRRDQMQRQAAQWGLPRLETALRLLVETDLALRSTSRAPAMAVMERSLIRLAMMQR